MTFLEETGLNEADEKDFPSNPFNWDVAVRDKNDKNDKNDEHPYCGWRGDMNKNEQLTLQEPRHQCRLGWYYDANRTVSKRSGKTLIKKPSYRYERIFSNANFPIGRLEDDTRSGLDIALDLYAKRKFTVFIPQDLWSQYPNENSLMLTVTKPENQENSNNPYVINPSVTDFHVIPPDNIWQRFRSWLNL